MTKSPMFAWLVFGLACLAGCSKITTTISTGMKMKDAAEMMTARGVSPAGPMAYSANNQSFNLPDGRCVVLIGDTTVDSIDVIVNPERPKSERESQQVEQIAF